MYFVFVVVIFVSVFQYLLQLVSHPFHTFAAAAPVGKPLIPPPSDSISTSRPATTTAPTASAESNSTAASLQPVPEDNTSDLF